MLSQQNIICSSVTKRGVVASSKHGQDDGEAPPLVKCWRSMLSLLGTTTNVSTPKEVLFLMSKDVPGFTLFNAKRFLEYLPKILRQRELKRRFAEADTFYKQQAVIREVYEEMTPVILERAAQGYLGQTNPYYVDWRKFMTPIEFDAWCSIRHKGIGLFPQYPALNYFLDFANPFLKVAVELDGKDWHDPAKDAKRDERLVADGWFIFRIPGRECYTNCPMLWDIEQDEYIDAQERDDQLRQYFNTTSDGVFEAVTIAYFVKQGFRSPYFEYAMESLSRHRIVEFDVYEKVQGL